MSMMMMIGGCVGEEENVVASHSTSVASAAPIDEVDSDDDLVCILIRLVLVLN